MTGKPASEGQYRISLELASRRYRVAMTIVMVVSCAGGAMGVIPSLLSYLSHPAVLSGPSSMLVLNMGSTLLGGLVGFFSAK